MLIYPFCKCLLLHSVSLVCGREGEKKKVNNPVNYKAIVTEVFGQHKSLLKKAVISQGYVFSALYTPGTQSVLLGSMVTHLSFESFSSSFLYLNLLLPDAQAHVQRYFWMYSFNESVEK